MCFSFAENGHLTEFEEQLSIQTLVLVGLEDARVSSA